MPSLTSWVSSKQGPAHVQRPWRFDFFTIWGNGLDHLDEILSLLRAQENLRIVRIETVRVDDMKKFVFDTYACDTVPIVHLRAKLAYLFAAPPEVVVVFARNLAPQESYFGEGPFRHLQCAYVKRIKEDIRNLYNPRTDGTRTEEHVIHASDCEEQVDYLLKLLGCDAGIRFLERDAVGLPFSIPYHIPRPLAYTFVTLPIGRLRATILIGGGGARSRKELVRIERTPHFRALREGPASYQAYYARFARTYLTDDHSWKYLAAMNAKTDDEIKAFDRIIVSANRRDFTILDGVHRAAVALHRGRKEIRCVVIEG